MSQKIETWITVNGNHIPILEGESKKEAVDKFVKNQNRVDTEQDTKKKQIKANKDEADKKNTTSESPVVHTTTKKDSRDLIPKDSYTSSAMYKKAEQDLSDALHSKQDVGKKYLEAYKRLEEARDKHLDPEAVQILGKREARILINDRSYPDTAEARQQVDRLHEQDKRLELTINTNQHLLDRLDTSNATKQREAYGTPEFKKASGEYKGFKTTESSTPYIDSKLKEGSAQVVEMTPEQYIHECAHYIFDNSTVEKTLRGRLSGDTKDTDNYASMMQQGVKFDTPYLDYSRQTQEGLHRAIAAYINGIDKMPVIIVGKRRQ